MGGGGAAGVATCSPSSPPLGCLPSTSPNPPPRRLPLLLQLSQVALQARGREHAGLAAELAGLRRELERYAGLPADADAARALTAAKRAELERLRRKLREHLDSLA